MPEILPETPRGREPSLRLRKTGDCLSRHRESDCSRKAIQPLALSLGWCVIRGFPGDKTSPLHPRLNSFGPPSLTHPLRKGTHSVAVDHPGLREQPNSCSPYRLFLRALQAIKQSSLFMFSISSQFRN